MVRLKPSLLVILMVLALIACSYSEGFIQYVWVVLSLLLLNLLLHKKLRMKGWGFLSLSLGLTLFYVIIAYYQIVNAQALGFSDGLLCGDIGPFRYYDAHYYYYEAQTLMNIIFSSEFHTWISGNVSSINWHYGPYNAFNILVALMMKAFGTDVMTLVCLKLYFSVISWYYLGSIVRDELSEKAASITVLIYALFPAYIGVSTMLMRDNIISCLMIIAFSLFIKFHKNNSLKMPHIMKLFFIMVLLCFFRWYAFVVMICGFLISIVLLLLRKKLNFSNGVLASFGIVITTILILVFEMQVGLFVSSSGIDIETTNWNLKHAHGIGLVVYSLVHALIGRFPVIDWPHFFFLAGWLDDISKWYLRFCLGFSLLAIVVRKRFPVTLVVFSFIVPYLLMVIFNYVFGGPVPRLYIMYLWATSILITYLMHTVDYRMKVITFSVVTLFTILQYLTRIY